MMHFREDAPRPKSITNAEYERRFNAIDWSDGKPSKLYSTGKGVLTSLPPPVELNCDEVSNEELKVHDLMMQDESNHNGE